LSQSNLVATIVAFCDTTQGMIIALMMLLFHDRCLLLGCELRFGWLLLAAILCSFVAINHRLLSLLLAIQRKKVRTAHCRHYCNRQHIKYMLFDIPFVADWHKIGEHRQSLTDCSNKRENY
jgi:hypothetical protein